MNNEISVQNSTLDIVMNTDIEMVSQQLQAIDKFQIIVQQTLKKDQDFGTIPGTPKPTLLKPGAEKILMLMGLTSEYEIVDKVEDYTNGFFAYTIKSSLLKNGQLITEGFGSANTKENRYQLKVWDDAERKKVWRGDYQDPYTLVNTVLKMAKKRAQVDAALTVGSLSNVFTQDIEDMKDFISTEKTETMNNGDASSMKVTFGKYKGRLLGDIYEEDKSYIEWISKNARDEAMQQAAKMLLDGKTGNATQEASKADDNTITKKQIDEINTLAGIVAAANNMSVEGVIQAYRVDDVEKLTQEVATELISRLNVKVSLAMEKAEPQQQQEQLFDDRKPPMPFEGTEVDIDDADLPF